MIRAVHAVKTIDRAACRRHAEEHFCVRRMALAHLKIYTGLIQQTESENGGHVKRGRYSDLVKA